MLLPHWLRPSRRTSPATPARRPLAPRWQPGVLQLEDRLAPATRLFQGLMFDAPSFTDAATTTAAGPVLVGKDPGAGAFQPLLKLSDGVSFDPANSTGAFTTPGSVIAVAGGQTRQLLDSGESHTLKAPALLDGGLTLPTGESDSSGFSVAGLNFKLGSVKFADNAVALQGSVAVPSLGGLTFAVQGDDTVTVGTSGVKLTGLDVTTSAPMSFTRSGVNFTVAEGLRARYAAADNRFELSGSASLTAAGNTVGLTLGTAATPGLMIAGGDLQSLDATVTTPTFALGGLNLSLASPRVKFDAAGNRFALTGGAAFTLAGSPISVTLDDDGLVLRDGAVVGVDAAVSGSVTVGGLSLTTDNLKLVMAEGASTLAVTGKATFALKGQSVAVTLGTAATTDEAATAGVVINKSTGTLVSMDATVDANLNLGPATFVGDKLRVQYTAATQDVRVTGKSSITLGTNTVSVELPAASGLVMSGGAFQSVTATVSGNVAVGGLTVRPDGLTLSYGVTGDMSLTGNAKFAFGGSDVALTLPGTGLVIRSGAVYSLDASVTGAIKVGGLAFTADGLALAYKAADNLVGLSGKAKIAVGSSTAVAVTLGTAAQPGLLLVNGAVSALNATVTGDIVVGGLTLTASGMSVEYRAATTDLRIKGTSSVLLPGGSANAAVTFGDKGLVLKSGVLESLDASLKGELKAGGLAVTFDALALTYAKATSTFTLTGAGQFSLGANNPVAIQLGSAATATQDATTGVTITNGSLTALDATVTGSVKAGVTLAADRLRMQYAAPSTVRVTGKSSFTLAGSDPVSVDLGSDGLLVSNGSLVSLKAKVDGAVKVGGLTVTPSDLALDYQASGSVVKVTGAARFALGSNTVSIDLTDTGLELADGKVTSLNATVNSNLVFGGLTFTASGMSVEFRAATTDLRIKGTSSVTLPGGTGTAAVSFTNGGLVIQSGSLVSLDATLTGNLKAGGLGVTFTGLNLTYSTATSDFGLKGAATFTLPGQASPVSITLGSATSNGVVLRAGQLVELNASVSTALKFGGLTFTASGMSVEYRALSDDIRIAGTSTVALPGGTGSASVAFGGQGIVIKSGTLSSLDATLNGNLKVGGLAVTLKDVAINYTGTTVSLKGTATFQAAGQLVQIALGSAGTPGLVISNGAVTTLNAAVTADLTFGGVKVQASNLGVQYTSADGTRVAVTGSALVALPGSTVRVAVVLGTAANPGLVFENGSLTSLNMGVTAEFNLKGLKVGVRDLAFGYVAASDRLTLSGALFLSTGGTAPLIDNLSATLGTATSPGLVVEGGELKRFDISVSGGFNLYGVSITAKDLRVKYDSGSGLVTISGTATAKMASISGSVTLPATGGGLTIDTSTGAVQVGAFSMALAAKVGSFGANLTLAYATTNGLVSVSGTGGVTIPGLGKVDAKFAVVNGQLDAIGLSLTTSLQIGQTPFFITYLGARLTGLSNPATVVFSGDIDVTLGRTVTLLGVTANILTVRGSLTVSADRMTIGGQLWLLAYATGVDGDNRPVYDSKLGKGSATLDLNWKAGVYSATVDVSLLDNAFQFNGGIYITNAGAITVKALATVRVPQSLPLIGGKQLGQVGFYLQVRPDNANETYAAAWANVSIGLIKTSIGFLYGPTRGLKLIGKDQISAIGSQTPPADSGYRQFDFVGGNGWQLSAVAKYHDVTWNGVDAQFIEVSSDALRPYGFAANDYSSIEIHAVGKKYFYAGGSTTVTRYLGSWSTLATDDLSGANNLAPNGMLRTFATNDPKVVVLPLWRDQAPLAVETTGDGYIIWQAPDTTSGYVATYDIRVITNFAFPANQFPVISTRPVPLRPTATFTSAAPTADGRLGFTVSAGSFTPTGMAADDTGTKVGVYYSFDPPGSDSTSRRLMTEEYLGGSAFTRASTFGQGLSRYTSGNWSGKWADYLSLVNDQAGGRPVYLSVTVNDGEREAVTSYYDANPATTAVDPMATPAPMTLTGPTAVTLHPATGVVVIPPGKLGLTAAGDSPFRLKLLAGGVALTQVDGPAGGVEYGTTRTFADKAALQTFLASSALYAKFPAGYAGPTDLTVQVTMATTAGVDFTSNLVLPLAAPTSLKVTATVSTPNPTVGQFTIITYTLTHAVNPLLTTGPAATGVAVTLDLPANMQFNGAGPSAGSYDVASRTWTVGTLAAGQAVTLTLYLRTLAGATAGPANAVTATPSGTTTAYTPDPVAAAPAVWPHLPIAVTTTDDVDDPADGLTSFREALTWAAGNPGADSIDLSLVADVLWVAGPLPTVSDAVTITGPGADRLTARRSGSGNYRFLDVADTGSLTLSGVAVDGFGGATVDGGAIRSAGQLALTGVDLRNNVGVAGGGLALFGSGGATLTDVRLSGNTATTGGGLFASTTGPVTVTRSLIDGNTAYSGGGGLFTNVGGTTVENSTIAGNTVTGSGGYGGGVAATYFANLTLAGTTVANNRLTAASPVRGAGVYSGSDEYASVTFNSALVADNTGPNGVRSDLWNRASAVKNLLGVSTGSAGVTHGVSGNQVGTAASPILPKLGALALTGGRLPTLPLLNGSPALNAGGAVGTADARGFARVYGAQADIGAYEAQSVDLQVQVGAVQPFNYTAGRSSVQFVLTHAGTSPLSATGVGGTLSLPPGLTGVGFTNPDLAYNPATGVWSLLTTLAPGATVTALFVFDIAADALPLAITRTLTVGVTATANQKLLDANKGSHSVGLSVTNPGPSVLYLAAQTTREDTATSPFQFAVPDQVTHLRFTGVVGGKLVSGSGQMPVTLGAYYPKSIAAFGSTLKFVPDADVNTAGGGEFGFFAQGSTTADAAGLIGSPVAVPVAVTAVNDAPTLTTVSELVLRSRADGPLNGASPGFASFVAGPTNEAGQGLAGYEVTVVSGAELFATAPSIYADGGLYFAVATNAAGTAQLRVRVRDAGGTADGGTDWSAAKTVTVTVLRPTTASLSAVNGGAAQRSRVTTLAVAFNNEVQVDAGAFRVVRTSDGAAVGQVAFTTRLVSGATVADLTFAGANTESGSLADGTWRVEVAAAKVRTVRGLFGLSADLTAGTVGRRFGDITGDGLTTSPDGSQFSAAYGRSRGAAGYVAAFDWNDDGTINGADRAAFLQRLV